jgi:predicted acyltransferase
VSTTPSAPPLDTEPIVIHVPPYDEASPAIRVRTLDTPPTVAVVPEAPARKRAFSLDALRGLFLVSMTFGFTITSEHLPAWMYHRQMTPAGDRIVDIVGISWRDLTYAAFLFTMAAALPLTLSRRIERGEPELAIIGASIKRYALLLIFGLLMAHANTYVLGYTQPARLLSILGFVVLALIYTRPRSDWNAERARLLRRVGWIGAILFLALTPLTYGKTFTFTRIDDIIVDLAFASLAGSLLWYVTRNRIGVRLGVMVAAVALYWLARSPGAIQDWWYASPAPWAFVPSRLSLLTVVVPGTIAGDAVLRWMRSTDESAGWSSARLAAIALITAAITPIVVVGMYTRNVGAMSLVVVALLAVGIALTYRATTSLDRMLRTLFAWGALWLAIGLALEPAEGGIRKVPETLTYFFTVTGLTCLLLAGMAALVDGLRRRNWVHALVDVGQNPLLGYVLFTVFLNPLLELIAPLRGVLESSPATSVVRSAIATLLVVLAVRYVTHERVFWRT